MEAINIYPELLSWKPNKQGMVPVAIRIDLNSQRVATDAIPHRINPIHWDKTKREVKSSDPNSIFLNQILSTRIQLYKTFVLRRQTFGLPISKDLLKTMAKGGASPDSFCEFAERVLENKTLKGGTGYTEETKRRYRDEIKRLLQYRESITFDMMSPEFLRAYRHWMQHSYKKKDGTLLSPNGIWNAFKFLRMIWNEAVEAQVVLPELNPFRTFKFDGYEQDLSKIKYLEREQVDQLEKILAMPHLKEITISIGWRFLAMCVCGMRISDAMNLDLAYFNDAGDLQFKPHKTRRYGNQATIPIISDRQRCYLKEALARTLPPTDYKNFRTTFNIHLKILAAHAGITINLTSHVGRHTMGSFLVDAGVEKKAAMAMLGVKSEKVIETYLHLKESKLQSEAMKLRNVF
jgi:integrase